MPHAIAVRTLKFAVLLVASFAVLALRSQGAEPAGGFEVHDVAVWMIERPGQAANNKSYYPSALPASVPTVRGAQGQLNGNLSINAGGGVVLQGGAQGFVINAGTTAVAPPAPARAKVLAERPAPVNLITFLGEPTANLDVDIRTRAGSFLAHWPPGEGLPNRLRWAGTPPYELVKKVDDAELMFADADHWMVKARDGDALYVKRGARSERFLAYDVELNLQAPLKLEGGPDTYTVINTTDAPLYDVLIARDTPEGRRVGWIDVLPKGDPSAAASAPNAVAPGAAVPLAPLPGAAAPPNGAPALPQLPPAAAAAQAAVAKAVAAEKLAADLAAKKAAAKAGVAPPAEQPVKDSPATKLFGGLPKGAVVGKAKPALGGVSVTLSKPLPADSPDAIAGTTQALVDRLTKAGLSAAESKLLAGRYGSVLFAGSELVVACRLDPAKIEELLPLSIFPAPSKTVRVGLVVLNNIDPRMGDEVDGLIVQLGDAKWKVREAAFQRLLELGPAAFPGLRKALSSEDPEIALRSERILLKQNETPDPRAGALNAVPPAGGVRVFRAGVALPAAAPAAPAPVLVKP